MLSLALLALFILSLNPDAVMDIPHTRDILDGIFSHALGTTISDCTLKRDLTMIDFHANIAGINPPMLREPLASILVNTVVRALITLWTTASVRPRNEPRFCIGPAVIVIGSTRLTIATPPVRPTVILSTIGRTIVVTAEGAVFTTIPGRVNVAAVVAPIIPAIIPAAHITAFVAAIVVGSAVSSVPSTPNKNGTPRISSTPPDTCSNSSTICSTCPK